MVILNWELYQRQLESSKLETKFNYRNLVTEAKTPETFEQFAKNRLGGALKITQNAKTKGGDALLTYHHFKVKLPYYKKAVAGKFNVEESIAELKNLHTELHAILDKFEAKDQIPFQKVMGKIEVVGELIIKYHEAHS
jgi:hypothetical protein